MVISKGHDGHDQEWNAFYSHGQSSVSFGIGSGKVEISFSNLEGSSLCALVPGLQFAGLLGHYDLHHPLEHQAV